MWTIARRAFADFIDKKSKAGLSLEEIEIESNESPYYKARIQDLLSCIEKYVDGENLKIIQLVLLEDKHSHEISNELVLKPATIRKRLSRCLKKVRKKCLNVWIPDACHLFANKEKIYTFKNNLENDSPWGPDKELDEYIHIERLNASDND